MHGVAAEDPWDNHGKPLEQTQKMSGVKGMDHAVLLLLLS
jgi:hypothetical protein